MSNPTKIFLNKTKEFQVDSTRLIPKEVIFQAGVIKVEKLIDSKTQQKLISHVLPLNGFNSQSLYEFLRIIYSLHNFKFEGLLPLYGISSDSQTLQILYYDDFDLNIVKLDLLSEQQINQLLKTTASIINFLHSNNFQHLRIKSSSIFTKDSNTFFIGCIQPLSLIDLEKEDLYLPFYKQPLQARDVFMFGLLIIEILNKKTQSELLDELWRFQEIINDDTPLKSLAHQCISHNYKTRPTSFQINNFFNGHETEKVEILEHSEFDRLFTETTTTIINLLIQGYLYTQAKEINKAISIYQNPLLQNTAHSYNNIGMLYLNIDKHKSFEYFLKGAEMNYAISQYNVGLCYLKGIGTSKDIAQSQHFLELSANQSYTEAIWEYSGLMRNINLYVSSKYLRIAARKTKPEAIHMYGLAIESGIGLDDDKSLDYFKVGVENDYPQSINNYASRIESKDPQLANQMWKHVAEMGLKHGQFNYGVSLIIGRGCEPNYEEGAKWLRLSSDQIYSRSMFDYAQLLKNGKGVEKDEKAADEMCIKAGKVKFFEQIKAQEIQDKLKELMDTFKEGEKRDKMKNDNK